MRPSNNMERIVNRKRYKVSNSTLLAGNDYWDGHNFERHGTNSYLYVTPNGNYFSVFLTRWEGGQDELIPISLNEAIQAYEDFSEHYEDFETAFPNTPVVDA